MTKAGYRFYFMNIVLIQAGWYHDTLALRATPAPQRETRSATVVSGECAWCNKISSFFRWGTLLFLVVMPAQAGIHCVPLVFRDWPISPPIIKMRLFGFVLRNFFVCVIPGPDPGIQVIIKSMRGNGYRPAPV